MKCLFCPNHSPCMKRDEDGRPCPKEAWDYYTYERGGTQVMVCAKHQPLTQEQLKEVERRLP